MVEDPKIPARTAPEDFPDALPSPPPTADELYQLMEVWGNVNRITSLRTEDWDGTGRCEYMLWTIKDSHQFRVIWDTEKKGNYLISERTKPL